MIATFLLCAFLAGPVPAPPDLASPRLAALRDEVGTAGPAALERFWKRIADEGTPLVEPLEGNEVLVTFLWRGGDETRSVVVVASPSDLATEEGIERAKMSRMPGTDVWYRSRRMRADARFGYALSVNDSLVPPFAEFLARELIPWIRGGYRVTADPLKTAIVGSSLGGLAAAFAASKHPDVFGNVLSLSGSFYWKPPEEIEFEWLARQLATGPKLPLRFYLEAGLMEDRQRPEGPSLLASNRHLRTVLQAKGYAVEYRELNGGHSILNWRGSLADGLLALFGKGPG